MKQTYKYAVSGLLAMALLIPSVSSAQGNEATIAALMEQIRQLQAQIAALQMQQQTVQNEMATVTELAKTLGEGAQGDDVRTLQAFLASDPSVYPEAVISGQYGRMTTNAVKRFQKKYGLQPVGTVDENTLRKLNTLLAEDDVELIVVRSGTGTDAVVCRRTPPGHFIAPGWLRKQGGNRLIIPDCQTLPPGIAKKLPPPGTTTPPADVIAPTVTVTSPFGGAMITGNVTLRANASDNGRVAGVQFLVDNSFVGGEDVTSPYTAIWNSRGVTNGTHNILAVARDRSGNRATSSPVSVTVNNGRFGAPTTTPPQQDTTKPVIFGLGTGSITASSVTVSWMTNEAATTKVYYSTTSPIATNTAPFREVSGLSTFHSVNVTELQPGTVYHLLVVSADAAGNTATKQTSFTTGSTDDTTAPVISNVVSSGIGSTTAAISWTTNEIATTKVYYSTVSPVVTATAPFQTVSGLRTSHTVNLTLLQPGTTYHVLVVSTDAEENMTSVPTSFTTTAAPQVDTTAPVISGVGVGPTTTTSALITWTTNEAATTRVYYSTASPVATATAPFQEVAGFRTSHSVNLPQLSAGTTYYLLIVSADTAGNTTSMPSSFTTMPLADTTAPAISNVVTSGIGSTTASVSWMTNEAATGKVYYGTTNPLLLSGSGSVSAPAFATSQNVSLGSLNASTTYQFVIVASDTANNHATSTQYSFTTLN